MCNLLSLVLYPKRAHSTSQTLPADYWGARMPHHSEQVYNHNLSSVTLNYPCSVNRQRVVSHNRTKRRVAGPVSRITLCLSYPYKFTTHPSDPRWGTGPPWGSRGRRRHFLMLMVDTPGSLSAPTRGAVVDVFNVDGGRSRISISTRQGACHRRFFNIDSGRSRISVNTYRGLVVDVFNVDGGRSRISISTSQGARRQCFLALIVGTPGSFGNTS
jgi:hypothetical protein